jgi:hypothetical protein
MSWLQEYSLHREDKLQPAHNLVRTPGHVLQELSVLTRNVNIPVKMSALLLLLVIITCFINSKALTQPQISQTR